ncbi:DegV family protein [Peptoniphilus sp. ING2-D1G]|nr:DegV family protein [Peptoniphilus sp. ING2-D1G]
MNIKIITDSGMDLDKEIIEKYDIEVLNIPVIDTENEYSSESLSSDELFENMKNKKVYSTSQISEFEYKKCFEDHINKGYEILYISLSSGITGTYHQAKKAEEELLTEHSGAKIHIFDSKSATCGMGLLVAKAALMAKSGESAKYILDELEFIREHNIHLFSVTTFEYLLRGGRVSKGSATIGNFLNVRPVLEVSRTDGKLRKVAMVRGGNMLYKKVSEGFLKFYSEDIKNQTICISYGDDIELANKAKEYILKKTDFEEKNILITQLGVVVGAHTGPGYIAIFFQDKIKDAKYQII